MHSKLTTRTIVAGSVGTVLEWYDFMIYAFLASVFAKQYFATGSEAISLIVAFGVFASGYLMRPAGGVIFGHVGDRIGRRPALIAAVGLMAVATTAIAALPTYETIGLAAPILLVALRLLQGIAAGGEYTGSIVFLVELAPLRRRALIGGFVLACGIMASALASAIASLLVHLLSADAFTDWGWRLLYAPAPLLGVIGVLLRRRLVAGGGDAAERRPPIVAVVRDYWPSLLTVMCLASVNAVGNYTVNIYGATYLQVVAGLPEATALNITTASIAALSTSILFFAWMADRVGRRPVMIFGAVGLLVCSLPLYSLAASGDALSALVAQIILAIFLGAVDGGLAVTMCELFPRKVRYTGVSVGYGLTFGVLGGTAPLVDTSLIDVTGNHLSPAFYVMLAAAVGLLTLVRMPETKGRALD